MVTKCLPLSDSGLGVLAFHPQSWRIVCKNEQSSAECECMLRKIQYISDFPASGMKLRHRNVKLTKMNLKGYFNPWAGCPLSADDGANRVEKDNGI